MAIVQERCGECGGFACFGLTGALGPIGSDGKRGEVWFCRDHRPADYFTLAAYVPRSGSVAPPRQGALL